MNVFLTGLTIWLLLAAGPVALEVAAGRHEREHLREWQGENETAAVDDPDDMAG